MLKSLSSQKCQNMKSMWVVFVCLFYLIHCVKGNWMVVVKILIGKHIIFKTALPLLFLI